MQGSRSSPCCPHSMGIGFLSQCFIAKFDYGGNCTVVWNFSKRDFQKERKPDPFVKAKERRFLSIYSCGKEASYSGFSAQGSVEGCSCRQAA